MSETKNDPYPLLVRGGWVNSPLAHLALYADQARAANETHVAVPADLLRRVSRFRECSVRKVFTSDEDGSIAPFEAECRRENGHDAATYGDHHRRHSNGYYTWDAASVTSEATP